jgi:LSU ribosomal protein L14P
MVVVVVKEGKPELRRQVFRAIVVRQEEALQKARRDLGGLLRTTR